MKTKHLLLTLLLAVLMPWAAMAQKTHIANTVSETAMTWSDFATYVNNGTTYEGMTIYLDEDIATSTMVGTVVNNTTIKPFMGTFDGQGHTITFNLGTASSRINVEQCAPFRFARGATIKNLRVTGAIYTSTQFASGFVARVQYDGITFINCESNILINSSKSGEARHSAFLANFNVGVASFEGCAFTGQFVGTSSTNWGGFVGHFSVGQGTVELSNCVFAPTQLNVNTSGGFTFARPSSGSSGVTTTNCYYTQTLGTAQGKLRYTVTAESPATVEMDGTPTHYDMSYITGYSDNTGLLYDGTIIAGSGDQMSLNLNGSNNGYLADHGTLTGTANPYTLTMEAYNTVIGTLKNHIVNTVTDPLTELTWETFASNVNNGITYEGVTVYLDEDIATSTMVGTSSNLFRGTFDGQGHTINFTKGTSSSRFNENYCAPFRHTGGATIKNLKVTGTIYTSKQFAAGIVARVTTNGIRIINCESDITLNTSVNGDGTHGGVVGYIAGTGSSSSVFEGSAFTGCLAGSNTNACGGFVGYSYASLTFNHCVFAPQQITVSTTNSCTFARASNVTVTVTNCYYTRTFGTAQGKLRYTVTAENPVFVALDGTPTNYDMSHITVYDDNVGLLYDGTIIAGSGDQLSLNLDGGDGYLADHGTLTGTANPYSLTMAAYNTVIRTIRNHIVNTVTDPTTELTWDEFASNVNSGATYSGITVYLDEDIATSTMVGTSSNLFQGTFDGQGHTVNFTKGTSSSRFNEDYCALFRYTIGATIKNLKVTGTIYTSKQFAGGIVARVNGNVSNGINLINCESNITINTSVNGDGSHGGMVAIIGVNTSAYIEGCVFTGSLMGSNTNACGGLVGYSDSNIQFNNCVFDPEQITLSTTNSRTFARAGNVTVTVTNCYYTQTLGTAQGKLRYFVTAGGSVTMEMNGTPTHYDVSHITAYSDNAGLLYDDIIIAGNGDQLSLNLGGGENYYANHGTLTGTANPYTLTMDANNVAIIWRYPSVPTDLQNSEATPSTTILSWTENGEATAWQICLNGDESNLVTATENPYTLTGLTGGHDYTVKVRSDYGEVQSDWSDPLSFTIPCGINSFPWKEDFNSYSNGFYFTPQHVPCWEYQNLISGIHRYLTIENGHLCLPRGGDDGYINGTYATLTLPPLTLPSENYAFSLDVCRDGHGQVEVFVSRSGGIDYLEPVGYISTQYDYMSGSGNSAMVSPENGAGWYTYSFNIPYSGSCYIVLRCLSDWAGHNNYTPKNLYMDNFCIREVPSGLAVSNITDSSADISWTPATDETEWHVQYGTYNAFYNGTFQQVTVTGSPSLVLNGLDPVQRYHVRVRAVYGSEKSGWSLPASFEMLPRYTIGDSFDTYLMVPTNNTTPYYFTQQIYTADELGDACTIRSIEFFKYAGTSCNRNLDVYLVSTDKASFESTEDWISVTSSDRVFSGTVNFSGDDWTVIKLQSPFEYDGQSNLALIVDDNTGFTQPNAYFGVITTTANQSRLSRNNSTNVNPSSPGECGFINKKNRLRLIKEYPIPSNPRRMGTTSTMATLGWTENGTAETWQLCINDDMDNLVEVGSNPYTLLNLNPETAYTVKIRSVCERNLHSDWSDALSFTTSPVITITEASPYYEDFEGYEATGYLQPGVVPDYWDACFEGYSHCYYTGESYLVPHIYQLSPDDKELYFDYGGSSYVALPEFANPLNTLSIDFNFTGHGPVEFVLGYITGAGNFEDFVPLETYIFLPNHPYYLNALPAEAKRLVFQYPSDNAIRGYLTDVTVSLLPTCYPIDVITTINSISDVWATTAVMNWGLIDNTQTAWQICLNDDEEHLIDADTHVDFLLEGLTPETTYGVKVRANCGDGDYSEWSNTIYFTTSEACPTPTNVTVSNISPVTADISWQGSPEIDDYTISYRRGAYIDGFYESFNNVSIPWANTGGWECKNGLLINILNGAALEEVYDGVIWFSENGNGIGVFDSHVACPIGMENIHAWLISPEIEVGQDNFLNFDLALTYNGWNDPPLAENRDDRFVVLVYNGSNWTPLREWNDTGSQYVYHNISCSETGENVSISLAGYAGQTVRVAFYAESNSEVNDMNLLHVDNVGVGIPVPVGEWQQVTATGNTVTPTHTLTGLAPSSRYEVFVKGNCEGAVESDTITFATLEQTTVPQTISLSAGVNWFSTNVEITMDDLKAALEAAATGNITITSQRNGMTTYNGTRWRGTLSTLDVAQSYRITVAGDCEITLEGMPVDPADHPITINSGANWIGFPLQENMSIADAFAGFAVNGDVINSQREGMATYNGTRWRGTLGNGSLKPGQGYIYKSAATGSRTFIFPTGAK